MRPYHSKFRLTLLRWHHRVGVVAALFVLLLSVTGILLNHTSELGLAKKALTSSALLSWYGVNPPKPVSYAASDNWYTSLGQQELFRDGEKLIECDAPFNGVVALSELLVLACADSLLLMSGDGELIEKLGAINGVPSPIVGLGLLDNHLMVKTPEAIYMSDDSLLSWPEASVSHDQVSWAISQTLPHEIEQRLRGQAAVSELSLERLLLDLHSGRFFGGFGVYLMDLMALLFVVLALSGLWVWATKPGRWHK